MVITLKRSYLPKMTLGLLTVGQKTFCTLEPHWLNNKNSISCIPEGFYNVFSKRSSIVERTSKGEFKEGWVLDVPERSQILIHIGNTVNDTEGCILIGRDFGYVNGEYGVIDSYTAFTEFMGVLPQYGTVFINVTTNRPDFKNWESV